MKPKNNFRTLREYFQETANGCTCMLGGREIELCYNNTTYTTELYNRLPDNLKYLYDYYVTCIWPRYKIVKDKIIVYLSVVLSDNLEYLI